MDTNKFGAYTAHTMARLFGTNGIRGVFGEDMSLQFAHDITLSLAAHFGNRTGTSRSAMMQLIALHSLA